jgi:hypothetical protein
MKISPMLKTLPDDLDVSTLPRLNTPYYTRNNAFLGDTTVNVCFEELRHMDEPKFRAWVAHLRATIVRLWDEEGCPPVTGQSYADVRQQFRDLSHEYVQDMFDKTDSDLIKYTGNLGIGVNQFFPTMMKVPINTSLDRTKGRSIYDYFARAEFLDKYLPYAKRQFQRDSFFLFSRPYKIGDVLPERKTSVPASSRELIESLRAHYKHDFFCIPVAEDAEYTGYATDKIDVDSFYTLSQDDYKTFVAEGLILAHQQNLWAGRDGTHGYRVSIYELGQRIFPKAFQAFRVGLPCQSVVNFQPAIAKALYERFTEHCKQEHVTVWDPSSGWGGRIVGAMCVSHDRQLHYIGCDPNRDHLFINHLGEVETKYGAIAATVNDVKNENSVDSMFVDDFTFPEGHTYELHVCGSETMQHQPAFQQYRGKLDLVFTSPPYFAKELYSQHESQSAIKFASYASWRDGFLYETLKTAYEWLRVNRYCLWNIADVRFGSEHLPLEADSVHIAESLGFKHVTTLKMLLRQAPGSGRTSDDGTATTKNAIKIGDRWVKFEPIYVFKKD